MTIDRNRFRVGWELETEKVNGATYGYNFYRLPPPTTPPEARIIDQLNRLYNTTFYNLPTSIQKKLISYLRAIDGVTYAPSAKFFDWDCSGWDTADIWEQIRYKWASSDNYVADAVWVICGCPTEGNSTIMASARAAMRQIAIDLLSSDSSSSLTLTPEGMAKFFELKGLPNKYSIERDGTVSGIEIKPAQPLDPDAALESYKVLTETLDSFAVSNRCSFHVHLSVDGLKHNYGINMQAWMYLYILNNLSRVPKGVLERWVNAGSVSEGDRYFKQKLGGSSNRDVAERYSFVAFRHEFMTWEFRCWGNIKEVADAKTCIDLSVEAYNYAFDLVHKQKKMAPLKEIDSFRETLTEMASSYLMYG
jgi:hypothetical protein